MMSRMSGTTPICPRRRKRTDSADGSPGRIDMPQEKSSPNCPAPAKNVEEELYAVGICTSGSLRWLDAKEVGLRIRVIGSPVCLKRLCALKARLRWHVLFPSRSKENTGSSVSSTAE